MLDKKVVELLNQHLLRHLLGYVLVGIDESILTIETNNVERVTAYVFFLYLSEHFSLER